MQVNQAASGSSLYDARFELNLQSTWLAIYITS
jgi:hypothetical protein